jgi:hypothetical protein
MFTWILPLNGNKLSLLLATFVVMEVAVSTPCSAAAEKLTAKPSLEEIHKVNILLQKIISERKDLVEDTPVTVKLEKKLSWSSQASNARLLLPVSIRYQGVINSYCRLATASRAIEDIVLVELPAQANFESCSSVSHLLYVDLNGDGMQDIVEGILVKSNAYPISVLTPIVYLSSGTAKSGYCYSDTASHQLAPVDLKSESTVRKALENARKRLGDTVYSCESL